VLVCSNYNKKNEEIAFHNFLNRNIDGLLLSTTILNKDFLKKFAKRNIPVVSFEQLFENNINPMIYYDNYKMTKNAIEHLIDNGYKKIALICEPPHISYNSTQRIRAYRDTLKENNLEVREDFIIAEESIGNWDLDVSENLILEFIKTKKPDSLLITKDILATMILSKLKRDGSRIPEDIGIIGFDNNRLSKYIYPSLTCISIPKFEMGEKGIEMLIDLIEKKEVKEKIIEVIPTLIVRESTNRLSGKKINILINEPSNYLK
jgi:DNA-binding LacI/PurR family transcriptional regulator